MSIFIVGADNLGNIPHNLEKMGFKTLRHLKGRKNLTKDEVHIPSNTDLVLVLTDYVNHNIAGLVKEKAKNSSIPVLFSKRSWTYLSEKLQPFCSNTVTVR